MNYKKKEHIKTTASRRKEIKIRTEKNKIANSKTIERTNKIQNQFFGAINKIHQYPARLSENKGKLKFLKV